MGHINTGCYRQWRFRLFHYNNIIEDQKSSSSFTCGFLDDMDNVDTCSGIPDAWLLSEDECQQFGCFNEALKILYPSTVTFESK